MTKYYNFTLILFVNEESGNQELSRVGKFKICILIFYFSILDFQIGKIRVVISKTILSPNFLYIS